MRPAFRIDPDPGAATRSAGEGQHMRYKLERVTLHELACAISAGELTATALVDASLARIAALDRRGPRLNAVPVLDPGARALAHALDEELRMSGPRTPLHGIPFVVKDSYAVEGLSLACGSPAFRSLRATRDAFLVERLRHAGAIPLGKTTMPPMAAGGMQLGLYGRAVSPYNPDYLPAAWFSGSSQGSGVAVAAGFAPFALAEETLSSGRSPASNNGLVAYTPSRGMLSMRGSWPFLALRDVPVPYTRTVLDLLLVLEVLWVDDPVTEGDLWRQQPWVRLPAVAEVRPARLDGIARADGLSGRRLAVPAQLIGARAAVGGDFVLDPEVADLWRQACADLEDLGAELHVVDVPALSQAEGWVPGARNAAARGWVPERFIDVEGHELAASGWDEFLRANADPAFDRLELADPDLIFPEHLRGYGSDRNPLPRHDWRRLVAGSRGGSRASLETPGLEVAVRGLERFRQEVLDRWLHEEGFDLLVFPAATGVAPARADTDPDACREAWRRGVEHSTGGFAIRELGLPTLTVPMGIGARTGMPVGLTFAATAYEDVSVIAAGYAFEQFRDRRSAPGCLADVRS